MSAIGPGDWVECLRVHCSGTEPWEPKVGGIYRVSAIFRGGHCLTCDSFVLDLAEDPFVNPFFGWCAACFRPIYREKASVIQSILAPVDLEKTDA